LTTDFKLLPRAATFWPISGHAIASGPHSGIVRFEDLLGARMKEVKKSL
jgi:hypothetical protein